MIGRSSGFSLFSPGDELRFHDAREWVRATVVHTSTKGVSLVTAKRGLWWVRASELKKRVRVLSAVRAVELAS